MTRLKASLEIMKELGSKKIILLKIENEFPVNLKMEYNLNELSKATQVIPKLCCPEGSEPARDSDNFPCWHESSGQ